MLRIVGPPVINYATHPNYVQHSGEENAPACLESQRVSPPPRPSYKREDPIAINPVIRNSRQPLKTWIDPLFLEELIASSRPFPDADLHALPESSQQLPSKSASQETAALNVNIDTHKLGTVNDVKTQTVMDGLAHSFQGLSTAGSSQHPQPPTLVAPPSPHTSYTRQKKKFYSVTVGKRCGVFSDW